MTVEANWPSPRSPAASSSESPTRNSVRGDPSLDDIVPDDFMMLRLRSNYERCPQRSDHTTVLRSRLLSAYNTLLPRRHRRSQPPAAPPVPLRSARRRCQSNSGAAERRRCLATYLVPAFSFISCLLVALVVVQNNTRLEDFWSASEQRCTMLHAACSRAHHVDSMGIQV